MTPKNDFSSGKTKTFPKLIIASTDECADLLYAGGFSAPALPMRISRSRARVMAT